MTNPSSLVPGIHYFCDHRCWRCSLTHRCAVFARWSQSPQATRAAGAGPSSRVAAALAVSLEVTMEDAAVMITSGTVPPPQVTTREVEADRPVQKRLFEFVERDPLVAQGAEYARGCWPMLQALRPILSRRGDAPATGRAKDIEPAIEIERDIEMDAIDRLEETCITVASKIFRAVSSALDADFDPADTQGDANGSAKVALLLIEESRQAWRVLMQPGRAAANGVPARQVAVLDRLEAELLNRFPHALEFVRPGFDTGHAVGVNGQLATAMLAAGRPTGTA